MKRTLALISTIFTALSTLLVLPSLPVGQAQTTGTVCIADISSTSCPPAPPSFTGPLGQQQQFAVNIQDSGALNAFDISVKTDAGILNPVSIDLTGSLIHDSRIILAECINNQGTGCRSGIDDYGVATLAVAAVDFDVPAPASGRLFSITYNPGDFVGILGDSTPIEFQTGCTNTSNNGFCVTVTDPTTGTAVPENLQEANFRFRDFSVRLSSSFQIIKKDADPTFTVTITSVGDFAGTINLSTSVSPITKRPPSPTLNPTSETLSPGSTSSSTLTVTTTRSTTVGRYEITITGTDGILTHSDTLILFIETR